MTFVTANVFFYTCQQVFLITPRPNRSLCVRIVVLITEVPWPVAETRIYFTRQHIWLQESIDSLEITLSLLFQIQLSRSRPYRLASWMVHCGVFLLCFIQSETCQNTLPEALWFVKTALWHMVTFWAPCCLKQHLIVRSDTDVVWPWSSSLVSLEVILFFFCLPFVSFVSWMFSLSCSHFQCRLAAVLWTLKPLTEVYSCVHRKRSLEMVSMIFIS